MAAELSQVTMPISAQQRLVSVEEQRIVLAAIEHLGAMAGASAVTPLGDVLTRTLTPTANRLAAALRAAGHQIGPEGQA